MPAKPKIDDKPIPILLSVVDRAFDRKSWHGPTLRGSLRNVDYNLALIRPSPKHHNIWEIVLHAAYWKYAVWRSLTKAPASSFPYPVSDWPLRGKTPTESDWKKDLDLLRQYHLKFRGAVEKSDPSQLHKKPAGSKVTPFEKITGIAAHDLYHAGQIQLLKRLIRGGVAGSGPNS